MQATTRDDKRDLEVWLDDITADSNDSGLLAVIMELRRSETDTDQRTSMQSHPDQLPELWRRTGEELTKLSS